MMRMAMMKTRKPDSVLLILPRCRKSDGGCGSTRLHLQHVEPINGNIAEIREYSCLNCGRRFRARVLEKEPSE